MTTREGKLEGIVLDAARGLNCSDRYRSAHKSRPSQESEYKWEARISEAWARDKSHRENIRGKSANLPRPDFRISSELHIHRGITLDRH